MEDLAAVEITFDSPNEIILFNETDSNETIDVIEELATTADEVDADIIESVVDEEVVEEKTVQVDIAEKETVEEIAALEIAIGVVVETSEVVNGESAKEFTVDQNIDGGPVQLDLVDVVAANEEEAVLNTDVQVTGTTGNGEGFVEESLD